MAAEDQDLSCTLAFAFTRRYIKFMQRAVIQIVNGAWLALVLVGVPVATSMHVGRFSLSSQPSMQNVTLWGLGLAVVGNLVIGLFVIKNAKVQSLCWMWALAFAALFGVEYLTFSGQLQFGWLKRALQWLQQKL